MCKQKSLLYLSSRRVIYIGRLNPIPSLNSSRSMLLVSIDKKMDMYIQAGKKPVQSKSLLIAPGEEVSIDTHNAIVLLCFLDVLGEDFSSLGKRMALCATDEKNKVYSNIDAEHYVAKQAFTMLSERAPAAFVFEKISDWIGIRDDSWRGAYDVRIAKAIDLIQSMYDENTAVKDISCQLNLSIPRLSQLFKSVTGVSIRRYRLCHRLYIVANRLGQGSSLTEAAIESGFSDYAHFSRTFRKMIGVSPIEMKKNVEICILQEHQLKQEYAV